MNCILEEKPRILEGVKLHIFELFDRSSHQNKSSLNEGSASFISISKSKTLPLHLPNQGIL